MAQVRFCAECGAQMHFCNCASVAALKRKEMDYSKYENANLVWPGATHKEMNDTWPVELLGPDKDHPLRAPGWYWYLPNWDEIGPYESETAAKLDRFNSFLFAPLVDWFEQLARPEVLGGENVRLSEN